MAATSIARTAAIIGLACLFLGGFPAIASQACGAHPRRAIVVTPAALELHRQCLVFDGHNDLPWEMRKKAGSSFDAADIGKGVEQFHTDIPRLRAGGVGAVFWSAYVPPDTVKKRTAAHDVLEQIDLIRRMVARYPETFELAGSADDVVRIRAEGKIASLIGLEGGHAIENSISLLRMYYELGARYMTLTHGDTLEWADAATDEARHGGLTDFGEQVVLAMNELGMLVDISHVSAETMRDALRVSRAPVIASHSSAYAIAPHPRNVLDEILELVAKNGGVVMVNYYSGFIVPSAAKARAGMFAVRRELHEKYPDEKEFQKALDLWAKEHPIEAGTIHDVLDHIDHIVKVAGVDHVGLGTDYDGVDKLPAQLEDVSTFPRITQGLLDRAYSAADIRKILGENTLRALRRAEQVAMQLQKKP
ncbi:MAG: membrane dipeptidase [Planctomycetaceae bacterium]|nr:membrane dipeptidase [Planctomycetaceae bacterium]